MPKRMKVERRPELQLLQRYSLVLAPAGRDVMLFLRSAPGAAFFGGAADRLPVRLRAGTAATARATSPMSRPASACRADRA